VRAAAVVLLALAAGALVVRGALAATSPAITAGTGASSQVSAGSATTTTPASTVVGQPQSRLSSARATKLFLENHKAASWLRRYPPNPQTTATYANGSWTVDVFYGPAGEIATGTVTDSNGAVSDVWTGPQVAWSMARGSTSAFGGRQINSYPTWLAFCAVFLLGLIDWRRPFSLRTLDLLALLSFSVSLWFFNRGNIFAAMPLVYPGFIWLIVRCLWIARRDRGSRGSVVWPTWLLLLVTVCLVGFRIDLNLNHSNVIDVGLSGVIGADRIAHFVDPYGNFPIEGNLPACGPADSSGEIRDRIQTNGKCEAADAQGDTYGPVAYEAYLPGYIYSGWSGLWDELPAAHDTSILWDLIAIIGLWLVGLRFGGPRLGATLAFAWAAWPFTQYASSSNTNDLIQPALLVWGFYFVTSPFKRGSFAALSAWTKFASLVVLPLWSGYPDTRPLRPRLRFVSGFLVATAVAFVVLLFDPSPLHAVRTFYRDTFAYQFGRSSPFSLWDWRQYHAKGLPNLRWVQRVLYGLLVAGALALGRWPRRRSPLRLAAYTGVLLVGFEVVLTHWSWLYLPWFFPFVAFALLLPSGSGEPSAVLADPWREQLRLLREKLSPLQLRFAGLGAAVALFVGSWAMLSTWFYANPRISDVGLYQAYGTQIRSGETPYLDFGVEYPPGSLPVFVAPTLNSHHYRRFFGWLMGACGALCLAFAALARPPRFALPWLALSPLMIGSVALTRFDFWPTVFVVAALAAFVRDRHRLGWAALGAAFAIKLYAVVLVPLAIVWTLRRRGRTELARCVAVIVAVAAAAFVPFVVLARHGLWTSIRGELTRPLQIETLAGSYFETFGHPQIVPSHGSLNLGGHGGLELAFGVVLAVVLLALWIGFARGPAEAARLARYTAACVCAFVVFGKVLSPQFLVWLVPLVPLTRGRRGVAATAMLSVALVMTLVFFPSRYYAYVFQGHLAWLVFGRDLMLLGMLAMLAVPWPFGRLDRRDGSPTVAARGAIRGARRSTDVP
jgi:Glycosyltransferase family 87